MNKHCKRLISLLLCLATVLPMLPAGVLAAEPETAAQPLSWDLDNTKVIDTVEEFMAIMDDPDGSYRLEADLDLSEVIPLGYDPETGDITHFTGSLDGNGCTLTYSIRNLPADAICIPLQTATTATEKAAWRAMPAELQVTQAAPGVAQSAATEITMPVISSCTTTGTKRGS